MLLKDFMNSNKNRILSKAQSLEELLATCPENQIIGDNLVKAWTKINSPIYKKIICSISGGSDSDVMLDICWRCDKNNKIIYVWFDTGLEYQATKDHLKYLENKYNIRIIRYKSVKPIPICRSVPKAPQKLFVLLSEAMEIRDFCIVQDSD